MKPFLAAIAMLLPAIAAADEPARATMAEASTKPRLSKAEKDAEAFAAVRDLAHNKGWLAEIAHEAASNGRQKRPKLPQGVAVTVARERMDNDTKKNPFADVLTGGANSPGPTMKPVACERAEGNKCMVRAILWVDSRKFDAEKVKRPE